MDPRNWKINWRWKEENWLQWVFVENAKGKVKNQVKTCYLLIVKTRIDKNLHKRKWSILYNFKTIKFLNIQKVYSL